ncbi:RNA polymerase sigma factor [Membranihabitans maritimus]|uniref:RNA polymerase sigma factor n=1 Tax=Membranihabitans maritimus TaxID=2904244 RepID=UPI001F3FE93A|nr:RNA polymerase sigma factor [Membranihabitans maritimus]
MDISLTLDHDEKSIIEACVRREKWAQKIIYEAHYGKMMGVCMRYAKTEEEALDILHDGFIKVFRYIKKYKPGTSLYSWIRRIMVNTAIDHYRKMSKRRTESIEHAYGVEGDEPSAIENVTEKEILKAVQSLTPTYRAVFNLYVIEGFSHREIAEKLDISESTSRSNLVKARSKLKKLLKHLRTD